MNKFYLIVAILISFQSTLCALDDSTSVVMNTNWSDSDKIRWLNEYSSRMLAQGNLIFAEKSALKALKLSELTEFNFGKAKAEVHLGQVAYNKKAYSEAEIHFYKAMELFHASGDKLNFSRAEAMNADVCFMENKLDSALAFYKNAMAQFNNGIIDDNLMAAIHKRTGDVYCRLDALDKASIEYDNAVLVYSDILKDSKKAGEVAVNIGSMFFALNHREEAIAYFDIGGRFFNQAKDSAFTASHFFTLSHILEESDETDLSINTAEKSLKIFTIRHDTAQMIENYAWLGELYALMKNKKSAIEHLEKAENLIKNLNDKSIVSKNYGNLGRGYEILGAKEKSAQYFSLLGTVRSEFQKQTKSITGKENILIYDGAQTETTTFSKRTFNNKLVTQTVNSHNYLRIVGIFLMLGTLLMSSFQFFKEKYRISKSNSRYKSRSVRKSLEHENEIPDLQNVIIPEIIPALPFVKIQNQELKLNETQHVSKINATPQEILDLISGHIEQIKILQKELSDKKTEEKYRLSFDALRSCVYELQVLMESIHTSIRLKDSTILNTETFFAPNDVFNYVKEQTVMPPRITVEYSIDARLPSLFIGNGMRLSQIIIQSIKGLSKPMIDGAVRVNLSRSEVIGDELTVKLDIESTGKGFIFDRLEKLINTSQPVQGSTDDSEAALLFVKKLIKSNNDEIFLHRTPQKIILTAFLTFEIPIPNNLSMTNVHESLLPKIERPKKTNP